jgi:hypothetical protein
MILLPNQDSFGRSQLSVIEDEPRIIEETIDGVVYVGYAKLDTLTSEPLWRIKRIQTIDGITRIGYAEGRLNYNYIWNDRISYNYEATINELYLLMEDGGYLLQENGERIIL